MKHLTACLATLVTLATAVAPASAGWDNVFQPTLFCRPRANESTSKYYVPPVVVSQSSPCPQPCAQPCPQPCTTQYIQRSYYQPVTAYETKTVMEPVTTYRTSYYYEPVTTVRYSSYYDPCTCSYGQVAVPSTSYQLREQKCPVQSWVSRCVQVPVQAYQKVDYWQPQTTCCQTTLGAPIYGSTPPPPPNVVPEMRQSERPPEIKSSTTPGTGGSSQMNQYYPPIEPSNGNKTSFQPQLGAPVPMQQPAPQPPVKLDRIAAGPNSVVEGQVVRADNSPKASAKVLFVNAATGQRQTIVANSAGRFQTELPAGSWHVYVHGANDLPIYQNRVDVNGSQFRQVSLVNP
jgi:hypothetical protein